MSTERPGKHSSEVPWRVGEHYKIHVYAGDVPVATFHSALDAKSAVRDHNAALAKDRDRRAGSQSIQSTRTQGGLIEGYDGSSDNVPAFWGGGHLMTVAEAHRYGKAMLDKLNEGRADDHPSQADPAL